MREPERLFLFYDTMRNLHMKLLPDWRFGQLMSNFWGWYWSKTKKDMFFPEEDEVLQYLTEYIKEVVGNERFDEYLSGTP